MSTPLPDEPAVHASWRRRGAVAALTGAVLVVTGGLVLSHGRSRDDGPLASLGGARLALPISQREDGALWGDALLANTGTEPITLLSATALVDDGAVDQLTDPVIWGRDRDLGDFGAIAAVQLPLDLDVVLPTEHAVAGYVLPPAGEGDNGVADELVFRFGRPQPRATIRGIRVSYRVGDRDYVETLPGSLVLCLEGSGEACVPEE